MSASKPPELATWMLEHLALGIDNDAISGDLLEEFKRRGSAGWYWRQVSAAIIEGFSRELGQQWKAAMFAIAWTFVETVIVRQVFLSAEFRSIHPWTLRHQQPELFAWFTAFEICLLILMAWLGLSVYLALMGVLNTQRLTRGLLICLFFIVLEIGAYLSGWVRFAHHMPRQFVQIVGPTPSFVGLLLSLCTTLPSRALRRSTNISHSGVSD